jgi:aryl-alcohol dehydrogenase-like predicted oxidoreductase
MDYRDLGTTGYRVSIIGLGCRMVGRDGPTSRPVDHNESIAAIQAGLDGGINYLTIAPSLGAAESEQLLGKALQARREGVVLADVCGPQARGSPTPVRVSTAEQIVSECHRSLRLLRTERIDVYLCHWPDVAAPLPEVVAALERLRTRGDIGAGGLSHYSCEQVNEVRRQNGVQVVQLTHNFFERESAADLLPFCREYRIGVVACDPLCGGSLAGAIHGDEGLSHVAARGEASRDAQWSANQEAIERLTAIASRLGCTLGQLAVGWVAAHSDVSVTVVDALRSTRVREYADAIDRSPPAAEEIDEILAVRDRRLDR